MKVLVTTPLYLLLVDLENRHVRPVEFHRAEYYGISWQPDGLDLYLSHSGLDNESLVDITTYARSETGWISYGKCETGKFLSQPHQIICAPDGRIVCSNTGRNCLTVIDLLKPGYFQEARISEPRWDRIFPEQNGGDHLNSVFINGDTLYVMAQRFDKGSLVAEFSYPDLTLLKTHACGNRRQLHNIWVTDEIQMIACHSETGALVELITDRVLWTCGLPIYLRGLAATDKVVILGESGRNKRDLRKTSVGGLWILDRETWKALDYLCLGPFGAVNEVRILDEPDLAHHGSPFAGLHTLIARDAWECQRSNRLAIERDYRNLDIIFGSPSMDAHAWLAATENDLCMAIIKTPTCANGIAFTYDLNLTKPGSHVGGVVAYRGEKEDNRMLVVLLQYNGKSTFGALWFSELTSWAPADQPLIIGLPNNGDARITSSGDVFILSIDEIECGRFAVPGRDLSGGVGVRWTNARIRNIHGFSLFDPERP
jgi:hypothetical protein